MADVKFSGLTALPGSSVVVADDILPIVDTSAGTSGSKKITVEELFKSASLTPYVDGVVLNKATGKGLKVDTAAPTFGYRDILGAIEVRGAGAADPTWSVFRGAISAYEFSATV
ncbi:MAG: hypothetical protein RL409_930, partial [Gemmatimonadota bacterium]